VLSMWPCKQNWMKKSQNVPVWLSSRMVLAQHICAKAGETHNKAYHLLSIGYIVWSLKVGFRSVVSVSHVCAVPILVLWWSWKKVK
jgi:N-acyl-L-homoserine lactone synthetase